MRSEETISSYQELDFVLQRYSYPTERNIQETDQKEDILNKINGSKPPMYSKCDLVPGFETVHNRLMQTHLVNHLNSFPVKSPPEKVRSIFFLQNPVLGVLTLSQNIVGSSLYHLAAVFTAKKRKFVL